MNRKTSITPFFFLFLLFFIFGGCPGINVQGDADTDVSPDSDHQTDSLPDTDDEVVSPRPLFDLEATTELEGFYDYPYPSDLRVTSRGAPDLTTFYRPLTAAILDGLIEDIARDIRGFSQSAGIYFRFTSAVDPSSLPQSLESSLEPDSSVFLIDIDDDSPFYGQKWPAEVTFREHEGRYFLPHTLIVRPPLSMPLQPATRYAAVVTHNIRGVGGSHPESDPLFQSLLSDSPPDGFETQWELYRPLVEVAEQQNFLDEIIVATVFSTTDHVGDLRLIRSWIHENLAPPEPFNWELLSGPGKKQGYALYAGRFELTEFLSGEPPYTNRGQGVIMFDPDGQPIPVRMVDVRFALSVPAGEQPESGWPIALYAHGAGGDWQSYLGSAGPWAHEVGFAMISMDNPMNGERDPEGGDFVDYLVGLAVQNMGAGRDMYRHGVVDHIQLARLVQNELVIPAAISHSGEAIQFDIDPLSFVGHSMGSQIGALLVSVEPTVETAFFSEGGGSVATALLMRKANDIDIEALVAMALGIDLEEEPLDSDHPVVGLLIQTLMDPADPMSYAYHAIRNPIGDPVHILMTEGLEDDQTIPVTIEALAAAYGLPIVGQVSQESEAHENWGISPTDLPAQDNVTVGPTPVTGGVLQFPGHGHYAFHRDPDARLWYQHWLVSSRISSPQIVELP